MGRLLIVSGVPASGKSSYCAWLSRQGWAFVNHDDANSSPREIDQVWWRCVTSGRAGDFVDIVRQGKQNVVVEYGFPVAWLPAVRQLKAAGAQHWWFEGDHAAARTVFNARNEEWARTGRHYLIPIGAFETYVRDITTHRDEIRRVFEPKVIETLRPDGGRLTVEEIHRRVMAGSLWPQSPPVGPKVGMNQPCWCGSGKKFKMCHGR